MSFSFLFFTVDDEVETVFLYHVGDVPGFCNELVQLSGKGSHFIALISSRYVYCCIIVWACYSREPVFHKVFYLFVKAHIHVSIDIERLRELFGCRVKNIFQLDAGLYVLCSKVLVTQLM